MSVLILVSSNGLVEDRIHQTIVGNKLALTFSINVFIKVNEQQILIVVKLMGFKHWEVHY